MSIKEKFKSLGSIDRKKFIKIISIAVVVIAVIVTSGIAISKKNAKKDDTKEIAQTSLVTRGNVQTTITGSGALEPYERYEVIPLVNGEITNAPYEVGDYVEEGSVLFEFDTTDAEINLAKQRNSMKKSTITYNESLEKKDDLIIKATCDGVVQEIKIEQGKDITAGTQITQIINNQDLKVKLPFNASQITNIHEGDAALVTSSVAMSSINGTVTNISATPQAGSDGASLYYVTISFQNPGAVADGDTFGGSVNGIVSPGSGTVKYGDVENIASSIAGTVSEIYCKEGDYVKEGDILVKLSSTDVENSLTRSRIEYEDARLSLENQENTLDDYRVTAPISGTVLIKNSKMGDTIDRTNSSVTMMVIGDVSKLKFTLSIDELDVSKVAIGQKVNITADAVENKTFVGEITNIAMEGTATNGVTTYEAQVTINNPQELKPSMNVDAVVVVESAENVLRVPTSDITTSMGRSYVFVKDDGTVVGAKDAKPAEMPKRGEMSGKAPQTTDRAAVTAEPIIEDVPQGENTERPQAPQNENGQRPQRPQREGQTPKSTETANTPNNGKTAEQSGRQMPQRAVRVPEAPEGFVTVEVVIGIQGDEFTEITSGLSEGQEIYQKEVSSSRSNMNFGMAGGMGTRSMGGGMYGGRSMGGGMAGGMRR